MKAALSPDKTKIFITAAYEDREMVKAIGGYKWNPFLNVWEFPVRVLPKILSRLKVDCDAEVKILGEKLLSEEKAFEARVELARKYLHGKAKRPKNLRHLYAHQYRAFKAASLFSSYALFMETGTGKTLTAIELIKLHKQKTLIVCPLSVIESVWMEELARWAPGFTTRNLWKDSLKDPAAIKKVNIFAINFESFKKLPQEFLTKIGFLIVDESSRMKDPRSQITKALLAASKFIPKRLVLSGTPAPNTPLEYWPQMAFVNPDILGPNFYVFRNTYFHAMGYGGFMYVCSMENKARIMERVKRQACFIAKADCLDLPEKVFEKREVEMSADQRKIYDQMLKVNLVELGDKAVLGANELAKLMKLRQITSGFAIADDSSPVRISDGKLHLLTELLEEIGPKQVIVWAQFHWEIEQIKAILAGKSAAIYGEVSQHEKEQAIKDFQSGKVQYLIAHPKSAGHGLTFVSCSYNVYFSLSYSLEEEKQSQDRTHRIGQKNRVTYIYLLAKDSIDEIIFKALRKKQNIADAMLEMIKR